MNIEELSQQVNKTGHTSISNQDIEDVMLQYMESHTISSLDTVITHLLEKNYQTAAAYIIRATGGTEDLDLLARLKKISKDLKANIKMRVEYKDKEKEEKMYQYRKKYYHQIRLDYRNMSPGRSIEHRTRQIYAGTLFVRA